jgi:hypothetical protein
MTETAAISDGARPPQHDAASPTGELVPLRRARLKIHCMLAYELDAACDFVFLIHAAPGPG